MYGTVFLLSAATHHSEAHADGRVETCALSVDIRWRLRLCQWRCMEERFPPKHVPEIFLPAFLLDEWASAQQKHWMRRGPLLLEENLRHKRN